MFVLVYMPKMAPPYTTCRNGLHNGFKIWKVEQSLKSPHMFFYLCSSLQCLYTPLHLTWRTHRADFIISMIYIRGSYKRGYFHSSISLHCHFHYLLHISLFSFSPYLSETLTHSLDVQNKITPPSPTHSAHILLYHSSCHAGGRPAKCHGDADGARLSRGLRVMYLWAFSRTIDLSVAQERRGGGACRREAGECRCTFSRLSIFRLSSDAGR